jgi:hypothetical protein
MQEITLIPNPGIVDEDITSADGTYGAREPGYVFRVNHVARDGKDLANRGEICHCIFQLVAMI